MYYKGIENERTAKGNELNVNSQVDALCKSEGLVVPLTYGDELGLYKVFRRQLHTR